MKNMSLNRFKYQIAKPGAPKAIIVGSGHPFYEREQIRLWKPNCIVPKAKKNSRKGATAGKTAPNQTETERN